MLTYDISSIINQATLSNTARTPSSEIDKNGFLQLLVKQMSAQDPLSPMDSNEFVSQLAQFGALEQSMNLNESFGQFLTFQKLTQASTLIGRQVICVVQSDDSESGVGTVKGTVEQVMMLNNTAYLKLSTGDEVTLESVVSVEPGGAS
jgi:flagellar basal-body rod modification protein FlgD